MDTRYDLFIGIDPDLHRTGIAAVHMAEGGVPKLLQTDVAEVLRCYVGLQACVLMGRSVHLSLDEVFSKWWEKLGDFRDIYLTVEGQKKYMGAGAERSNPESLIRLAHVTGAAASWQPPSQYFGRLHSRIVEPGQWKGQVPKDICQARAFSKLRIKCETKDAGYCVPQTESGEILHGHKAGSWKHIGDAAALALWTFEQVTGRSESEWVQTT